MEDLKNILESLLFIADEPLSVDRLKAIVVEAEAREIRQALDELQDQYQQREGGFTLRQVAGGYQFRSRNMYNEWIKRLIAPAPVRISKAALETLAIIAYKQPVIRSDVEHIRGVDCGGVLRVLMERQLIRVLGRKEIPGRPLIYATTKKFLEVFDLKDLRDLPSPKEIENFGQAIADGQVQVLEKDEPVPGESIAPDEANPAEAIEPDEAGPSEPFEPDEASPDEATEREEDGGVAAEGSTANAASDGDGDFRQELPVEATGEQTDDPTPSEPGA